MSAPSDGARADARKRLAANVPPIDDMRRLPDLLHTLFPCGDTSDLDAPPCWTAAQAVLASDWLAGVIADAKAAALREAAKEMAVDAKSVYWRDDSSFHASQRWALTDTAPDWLRDRAKRIEQESGR